MVPSSGRRSPDAPSGTNKTIATGEDLAGSAKPRAGRPMNRAVNAAAAEQSLVCGIDDGVDVKLGDVAFDDLDAVRHALLTRRLAGRSSE